MLGKISDYFCIFFPLGNDNRGNINVCVRNLISIYNSMIVFFLSCQTKKGKKKKRDHIKSFEGNNIQSVDKYKNMDDM